MELLYITTAFPVLKKEYTFYIPADIKFTEIQYQTQKSVQLPVMDLEMNIFSTTLLLKAELQSYLVEDIIMSLSVKIPTNLTNYRSHLVKSENKYYDKIGAKVVGTYSDSKNVNLSVADVTVGYKKGTLEITLKDITGKALANKSGTVTIDGNVQEFITNENGTASINLALTTGNYTAKVHTVSDYYNKAGNAEAAITVVDDRASAALTAPGKTFYLQAIAKGSNYQVTLKFNGKALASKDVIINYNGKTITAKTNSNGVATFKLTATATGSKQATITFKGDDAYKPTTAKATIKVTKEASKIAAKKKTFKAKAKTKKYAITLKSKSGKAISGVKVTIKIKNKKFTAKTNSKGKATFKIKKFTKKGTFKSTVTFAGNKYFSKATAKVKIKMK